MKYTLLGVLAFLGLTSPLTTLESESYYYKILSDFQSDTSSQGLNTPDAYFEYFQSQIDLASFGNLSELYAITELNLMYVTLLREIDKRGSDNSLKNLLASWRSKEKDISAVDKKIRSDYYRAYADVLSRTLSITSGMAEIIKLSRTATQMYDLALKLDSKNARAYLGYGIWSYYSPIIGGGGYKKAKKYFDNAIKFSTNKFTTFMSYVWLSQVFFHTEEDDDYQKTMTLASSLFPRSYWLAEIQIDNDKGNTL